MGRILGLDYGQKRTGIAISDSSHSFASPRSVIEGEPALLKEVARLVEAEDIVRIVLGLPLNMNGTAGPKAAEVLAFKARLERAVTIPVETWDERLSTVQADLALREGGMSDRKRGLHVDKVAAQIILQSYLDRQRRIKEEEAYENDPDER
jgi:putative Holliday junction resolvase